MAVSLDAIKAILTNEGIEVLDQCVLPGRRATFSAAPGGLDPLVRGVLDKQYPGGLFSHQASALSHYLDGEDVCLATSTASGKSLVFLAAAAHLCHSDPSAKVLALYPAKALIQDQLSKWQEFLASQSLACGFIYGGVPTADREAIIASMNVVLMTPDVAHAWLMSQIGKPAVTDFIRRIQLLVLDEAHVYEGVFGTNMAYFLRRFECAARRYQIITSTATLSGQSEFIQQLTGRQAAIFGEDEEGSAAPEKTVLHVKANNFDSVSGLIRALATEQESRFLAFADSRKMVERLVAAARRVVPATAGGKDEIEPEPPDDDDAIPGPHGVYPYRAGYLIDDRARIQQALSNGDLKGVVSTSALELGVDIGEIDLVALLSVPRSVKALKQRIGRAGRQNAAVCLIVDSRRELETMRLTLGEFLARPAEPNWLYLENRYLQYANALCAAVELAAAPAASRRPLEGLPTTFASMLDNELNPVSEVPDDLYPLKQRAAGGPHREFPIRSDMEQNFDIMTSQSHDMGEITLAQSLREAYPGAVYYYMAKPYRVTAYKYRDGQILVKREKFLTTEPVGQTTVFPRFSGAFLFKRSGSSFVAESQLQVSERVTGFSELRGSVRQQYKYEVGSPWYQRELNRFFRTTGVSWATPDAPAASTVPVASAILEAFSREYGIHPRDVGAGSFYSQVSPVGPRECRGVCVYDATNGSLRLTQRLIESFEDIVRIALEEAQLAEDSALGDGLKLLLDAAIGMQPAPVANVGAVAEDEDGWRVVIAPGQPAMCGTGNAMRQVKVKGYRYTPTGVMYDLEPVDPGVNGYSAPERSVEPINGLTRLQRVNFVTEEVQDI